MRVFVDLDTQKLIASPGLVQEITTLNFKRSPYANIEVQFTRNGTVVELPEPATGIWGIKPAGKYDDDYVTAALSWVKTGSGETTVYTFIFTYITDPLDALFFVDGDSANDVPFLTLMGELQWTTGGSTLKTPTISIVVANDVNRGGETVPSLPPVAYGVFLPSIIDLTGGDVEGIRDVPAVTDPGTGYAVGDILTLSGGTFVQSAQLKVTTIGIDGAITGISINREGQYSITPASPAAVTGGGGTDATFTPTWVVVSPIYLDAIPTIGTILTGTIVEILIEFEGERQWLTYVLTAGIAAGYGVVEPLDYDAVDNDRRWLGARGPAGPPGKDTGVRYKFSDDTAITDPTTGFLKFNNANLALATKLSISTTNGDGINLTGFIETWDASTSAMRGRLQLAPFYDGDQLQIFSITAARVDHSGWIEFTIAPVVVTIAAPFLNLDFIRVQFSRTGDKGSTGVTGGAGPGVPTGGTAGQVLAKIDSTNYNTEWVDASGGGGSVLADIDTDGTDAFVDILAIPQTSKNIRIEGWLRAYNSDFDDVASDISIYFNADHDNGNYRFSQTDNGVSTNGIGSCVIGKTDNYGRQKIVIEIPQYSTTSFPTAYSRSNRLTAGSVLSKFDSMIEAVGAAAAITEIRIATSVARLELHARVILS